MRTILILLDSLNRRFLRCYGANRPAFTPSIDRLASRSAVFDNHYCGSSPCMPARRDLMTGRLNFLERPWGGIEAFDHTLPSILKSYGVFSCIITDHYHYAEAGGENYFHNFSSWRLIRGQEHDVVFHSPGPHGLITPPFSASSSRFFIPTSYAQCRRHFQAAEDYPTPRTFTDAARWLEENHSSDHFFLWVEGFDPHEPFDVPQEYLDIYHDDYKGPLLFWPKYSTTEQYTPDEIQHLRRRYLATLTMADTFLGRLLDVLDRHHMWEDTQVIFTTDHGYMLGEHGFWAKNYTPDYHEIFHIPLLIHQPGQKEPFHISGLTQNIDLFPTILESFQIPLSACRNPLHGRSLLPLLRQESVHVRHAILFGQFGKTVNLTDGRYTYFRQAVRQDNQPLFLYTSMPTCRLQYLGWEGMDPRDFSHITLSHMSWHPFPVYRFPANLIRFQSKSQSFQVRNPYVTGNWLFDNVSDYAQEHPICDPSLEAHYTQLMQQLMQQHDAPEEQYVRLGLSPL